MDAIQDGFCCVSIMNQVRRTRSSFVESIWTDLCIAAISGIAVWVMMSLNSQIIYVEHKWVCTSQTQFSLQPSDLAASFGNRARMEIHWRNQSRPSQSRLQVQQPIIKCNEEMLGPAPGTRVCKERRLHWLRGKDRIPSQGEEKILQSRTFSTSTGKKDTGKGVGNSLSSKFP